MGFFPGLAEKFGPFFFDVILFFPQLLFQKINFLSGFDQFRLFPFDFCFIFLQFG